MATYYFLDFYQSSHLKLFVNRVFIIYALIVAEHKLLYSQKSVTRVSGHFVLLLRCTPISISSEVVGISESCMATSQDSRGCNSIVPISCHALSCSSSLFEVNVICFLSEWHEFSIFQLIAILNSKTY